MNQPTRLFDFPYYQKAKFPREDAFVCKRNGDWVKTSTDEFIETGTAFSLGLLKMGIEPGDRIALISHNNNTDWNLADFGVLQMGGVDVPVYPTISSEDYAYIFNNCQAKLCFVSNEELYQKVKAIKDMVPSLIEIYSFTDVPGCKNWNEVIDLGRKEEQTRLEEIKLTIKETDLATLIYTSGTTGKPKGVMLSHKNIASNAVTSSERLPEMNPGTSRALSFLPVCHIFERMLHYLYMYNGVAVHFAESLETIKEDLNATKPHIFTAVPRLLEKFYDGIVAKGTSAGGIKAGLFKWAVNLALQWEPEGQNGGFYEWKLGIARKLVFSKVKTALGLTEIRGVASGAAALQPRLARFFNGAGIPVLEGYGLTETSPVIAVNTINNPGMLKVGTVGKPIRDVEVKIAEDGEIIVRGPNVMMGYYQNDEMTAEVLEKDGWFHTGDIGEMDAQGFLKITDRKKEMFKTSGGKYIAPQILENAFKESSFIENIMVVGEGEKHPAAFIQPDFSYLKSWCEHKGIKYTSDEEVLQLPEVINRYQREVDAKNERFGKWEQVKKFALTPDVWSIEKGDLTPTLKLKRRNVIKRYAHLYEKIYEHPIES